MERGERLREEVPFETHAAWNPPMDRPDPVGLLKSQGASRVQELLPVRHERMSASAFTFYRGGALIMASDLSTTPSTGIRVQACGDAHISNFGLFSSPERRTVFDINDFDETSAGPWEWDVKRLAASVEICGRDCGFSKSERKDAVRGCVRAYRQAMADFARMGNLEVWYAHFDADSFLDRFSQGMSKKQAKVAAKALGKAKRKDSARAVGKLTEVVDVYDYVLGRGLRVDVLVNNVGYGDLYPTTEIGRLDGERVPLGTLVNPQFDNYTDFHFCEFYFSIKEPPCS